MDKEESIVVDLFNGYALAFFFTMGLGSIMIQLYNVIGWELFYNLGSTLTAITGPVIGVMIGIKLGLSAVGCGSLMMVGGIAQYKSSSPALMAFILCIIAGIIIREVAKYDKFSIDLFVMPIIAIIIGYFGCQYGEPLVASLIQFISSKYAQWDAEGTVFSYMKISVLSGFLFSSPVGLTNFAFVINFSRLGLIAATCGVISFMVGLAVMGVLDNPVGTSLAVGIGTSTFQFGNIIRRPLIVVPPVIAACLATFLGTAVRIFDFTSTVNAMKFGTTALYAYIELFTTNTIVEWIPIIVIFIIVPAGVTFGIYFAMKKVNLLHDGDLTINL